MEERFMRRALEIARDSLDSDGALPYAAVIVKDGEIVGEGLNRAFAKHDPTSHGEIEAIRDACARLGTTQLEGSDLYTTAEPCAMCVATMYVSGIANLYYAGAVDDTAAFFKRLAAVDDKYRRRLTNDALRTEVGAPLGERQMPARQMLADEARQLFADFASRRDA